MKSVLLFVFLLSAFQCFSVSAFAQLLLPDSLLRPDSLGIYHPAAMPQRERRFYVIPAPVVAYTPDTGWLGGVYVAAITHLRGAKQPSTLPLKIIYSERKQLVASIEPELMSRNWRVKNETEYQRWPSTFWGIGNATRDGQEEQFTAQSFRFELGVSKQVRPHLYLGLGEKFKQIKITKVEVGKRLETAGPRGMKTISGLGAGGAWDTRDNNFFPHSGSYHQLSMYVFRRGLGSDYTYNRYWIDLRRYLPLGGTHTLAVQGFGAFTEGTPHLLHARAPRWRNAPARLQRRPLSRQSIRHGAGRIPLPHRLAIPRRGLRRRGRRLR